jgi:hypothetical protein
MKTTTITIAIALAVAVFVTGLIVVPVMEEANAGCERGAAGSFAFNASKGRCFDRGTF